MAMLNNQRVYFVDITHGMYSRTLEKSDGMGTYTINHIQYLAILMLIYIYILVYIQNLTRHFFSFFRVSKIGHDNRCLVVVFSGANGPPL